MATLELRCRRDPKTVIIKTVTFPDYDLESIVGKQRIVARLLQLISAMNKTIADLKAQERLKKDSKKTVDVFVKGAE